jgi:hypothetical protein
MKWSSPLKVAAPPAALGRLCVAIFVAGALASTAARAQVAPTDKIAGDLP